MKFTDREGILHGSNRDAPDSLRSAVNLQSVANLDTGVRAEVERQKRPGHAGHNAAELVRAFLRSLLLGLILRLQLDLLAKRDGNLVDGIR